MEQNKEIREVKNQIINCINLKEKSMMIIQIEKEVYFADIKKLRKLSNLSKDYCFYERNKILNDNQIISRGIYYIQYRCRLKGGGKTIWCESQTSKNGIQCKTIY
jgi:hypothetical protein